MNNLKEKHSEIFKWFEDRGCLLTNFTKNDEKLKFICKCGVEKERTFKDHKDLLTKKKECQTCRTKKLANEKPSEENIVDPETGETWIPIVGGWVSNLGKAKNFDYVDLKPSIDQGRCRVFMAGKKQPIGRLVAEAFQIENYKQLSDKSYIVKHIDGNVCNNYIENLKITTKSKK